MCILCVLYFLCKMSDKNNPFQETLQSQSEQWHSEKEQSELKKNEEKVKKNLVSRLSEELKEFHKAWWKNVEDKDAFFEEYFHHLTAKYGENIIKKLDPKRLKTRTFSLLKHKWLSLWTLSKGSLHKELSLLHKSQKDAMTEQLSALQREVTQWSFKHIFEQTGLSFSVFLKEQWIELLDGKFILRPQRTKVKSLADIEKARRAYIWTKVTQESLGMTWADGAMKQIFSVWYDHLHTLLVTSAVRQYEDTLQQHGNRKQLEAFRQKFTDYTEWHTPTIFSDYQTIPSFQSALQAFFAQQNIDDALVKQLEKTTVTYKNMYKAGVDVGIYKKNQSMWDTIPLSEVAQDFFTDFELLSSRQIIKDFVEQKEFAREVAWDLRDAFDAPKTLNQFLQKWKELESYYSSLDSQKNGTATEVSLQDYKDYKSIQKEIWALYLKKDEEKDHIEKQNIQQEILTKEKKQTEIRTRISSKNQDKQAWATYAEDLADLLWDPSLAPLLKNLQKHAFDPSKLTTKEQWKLSTYMMQEQLKKIEDMWDFGKHLGFDMKSYKTFLEWIYDLDVPWVEIELWSSGKKLDFVFASKKGADGDTWLQKGFLWKAITQQDVTVKQIAEADTMPYTVSLDMAKSWQESEDFLENVFKLAWTTSPFWNFAGRDTQSKRNWVRVADWYKVSITHPDTWETVSWYLSRYWNVVDEKNNGQEVFLYDTSPSLPSKTRTLLSWKDGSPVVFWSAEEEKKYTITVDESEKILHLNKDNLTAFVSTHLIAKNLPDDDNFDYVNHEKEMQDSINDFMSEWSIWAGWYADTFNKDLDKETVFVDQNAPSEMKEDLLQDDVLQERDEIAWSPSPDKQHIWATLQPWVYLWIKTDYRSEFPPLGSSKYRSCMEVVDVDKSSLPRNVTRKAKPWHGSIGDLEGKTYTRPFNESFLSNVKKKSSKDGLLRMPPSGNLSFDQYLKSIQSQGTIKPDLFHDLMDVNFDGKNFIKDKKKVVFYVPEEHAPSYTLKEYDGRLEHQKVFYSIQQSGTWKYEISCEYIAKDKDNTDEKKKNDLVKLAYKAEVDNAWLATFFAERAWTLATASLEKEKWEEKSEYEQMKDQEKERQQGFSWSMPPGKIYPITINSIVWSFKNLYSKIQDRFKERNTKETYEFTNMLIWWEDGFFKSLSNLPIIWGALEEIYFQHKKEKDGKMMAKIQYYLDNKFSTDLHHTLVINKEVTPLFQKIAKVTSKWDLIDLKWAWTELSLEERYQAAAALLYMNDKDGMYARSMAKYMNTWIYVRALLWHSAWLRYKSEREKLENMAKNPTDNSRALTALARLEIDFIVDNLRWGYYFSKAWSPNDLFLQQYPRELAKKIFNSYDEKQGEKWWKDEMDHKLKIWRFEFALEEFEWMIKSNRFFPAYWSLKAMYTLASTPQDKSIFYRCAFTLMMSGLQFFGTDYNFKNDELQVFFRSIHLPIADRAVRDWQHQEKIASIFDIATGWSFTDKKWANYSAKDFTYNNVHKNLWWINSFASWRDTSGTDWKPHWDQILEFLSWNPWEDSMIRILDQSQKNEDYMYKWKKLSDTQQKNLNELVGKYAESARWKQLIPLNTMSTKDALYKNMPLHAKIFDTYSSPWDSPESWQVYDSIRNNQIEESEDQQHVKFDAIQIEELKFTTIKILTILWSVIDESAVSKLARVAKTIQTSPTMSKTEKDRLVASTLYWSAWQGKGPHRKVDATFRNYIQFFCNNIELMQEDVRNEIDDFNSAPDTSSLAYKHNPYVYIDPVIRWRWNSHELQRRREKRRQQARAEDKEIINEELERLSDSYKQKKVQALDTATPRWRQFLKDVYWIWTASKKNQDDVSQLKREQELQQQVQSERIQSIEENKTKVAVLNPEAYDKKDAYTLESIQEDLPLDTLLETDEQIVEFIEGRYKLMDVKNIVERLRGTMFVRSRPKTAKDLISSEDVINYLKTRFEWADEYRQKAIANKLESSIQRSDSRSAAS